MRRFAVALAMAGALPWAATAQTWRISPGVTLSETWYESPRQVEEGQSGSGWITSVIPSVAIEHRGPLLRLSADYRHQRDSYSGSTEDVSRNFLNALARYDFVEQRVWLESSASITQERRSAFGAAALSGTPAENENRAETRVFSASPVARGALGDIAVYQVRGNISALRSQGSADIDTSEVAASVRSAAAAARFGWSADVAGFTSRSNSFGTLQDWRARAAIVYAPMAQVHVSFIQGYELSDFAPADERRQSTPGLGLEWSPGPRTQIAVVGQKRFFGTGYLGTLRHRSARTAWALRATRDATVLSTTLGGGVLTLGALMSDLLAASAPDPVTRSAAVRRRLSEFGSAPTSVSGTGFLTERPFLQQGVDGSVAMVGARNTLTLGFQRNSQKALLVGPTVVADSFSESGTIRTRGFNAAVTHRMTPHTSITVAATRLNTFAQATASSSNQDVATVVLSTRLGPRATASFGLRRGDFESSSQRGYEERAVFGSVTFRL